MDPLQNPQNPPQPQAPMPPQQPPAPPQAEQTPPPQPQGDGQHQVVQVMRPVNPSAPAIPQEIQQRTEVSKKQYPHLNLSPGEFVIYSVRRHPIGIIKIWALVIVLIVAMLTLAFFFTSLSNVEGAIATSAATNTLLFASVLFLSVLFALGGIIATFVYNSNRFYLTNESVIQEIMPSLFSRNVQTVSLSNIEDASFRQDGILPHLLNYGDIRLSTEGDETTYRFSYVADPDYHIAKLNNAVEAFKNGRPVLYAED
jgi:hypothetical protein